MKKYVAALGSAMFFVICVSLYLMLETVNETRGIDSALDQEGLKNIEIKIKEIEKDLGDNQNTINAIRDSIRDIAGGNGKLGSEKLQGVIKKLQPTGGHISERIEHVKESLMNVNPKTKEQLAGNVCGFSQNPPKGADIQMMDVFNKISFDNPDGGVWKQGYDISYDSSSWNEHKLQVFVIPHSHTDPGWIKTFEKYYSDQTRQIFQHMVEKLEHFPKMKFIYAEMSFFSLWWHEINQAMKDRVKKLIEKGQLEIVTGGWVMNDEANAHYFAMIDQLIEGNQWLHNQLGVSPKSGWAIDPFGHTSTMAYLLKNMGFENMLIQRTHYAIKKYFSKKQQLEFQWRQNWDQSGNTDMVCHMMPFYSYDVPHTCGPDPKVCCQFDFKRLPGGRVSCPWKIPPVSITNANVEQRARMLLDQYRKKSQLYKTNVLLIPLGDDYRYDTPFEWDNQYTNYQSLFDYLNNQPDLHVQAQFGTLSDYFDAMRAELANTQATLPVLSGDFFSYADRDDHYWTGYFTSRPYYKRLSRLIEYHARAGEILFSQAVAVARQHQLTSFPVRDLMAKLTVARRAMGLYQHHDGVTGTGKDFVNQDYGKRMLDGINNMKLIIRHSSQLLLTDQPASYDPNTLVFDVDETRMTHDSLPERTVIRLFGSVIQPVVFYNSLGYKRSCVVRVYVSAPDVRVEGPDGQVISSQADPYWTSNGDFASTIFKLSFEITVPALGLAKYHIQVDADNPKHHFSKVHIYNGELSWKASSNSHFVVQEGKSQELILENGDISAKVSSTTGTLSSMTLKDGDHTLQTKLSFLMYGTVSAKDRSGAYLFLPDGQAKPVYTNSPYIRHIQGPIVSEVHTLFQHVEHVTRVQNSAGIDSLSVDIFNIVDIRQETNRELSMRVETGIQNKDREFYTDLNGFQMQKRKTLDKLPLQGNFYPMPAMAYIEDTDFRFSILSGQSLGTAGLNQGWLEVIQDRRLNQDDNRGLGQGVLDNKRTPNKFRFLMEKRSDVSKMPATQPTGFPSLVGHLTSEELVHPVHVLPPAEGGVSSVLKTTHSTLKTDLPCGLSLLNWKTLLHPEADPAMEYQPREDTAWLLHRHALDCSYPAKVLTCSQNTLMSTDNLLNDLTIEKAVPTSLNLLHDKPEPTKELSVPPMEIQAYKLYIK